LSFKSDEDKKNATHQFEIMMGSTILN